MSLPLLPRRLSQGASASSLEGAARGSSSLRRRVEAWNRFGIEGETNIQDLPITAAGAAAATATETRSSAGRPKL